LGLVEVRLGVPTFVGIKSLVGPNYCQRAVPEPAEGAPVCENITKSRSQSKGGPSVFRRVVEHTSAVVEPFDDAQGP
jgi:hypothetical protein